MSAQDTPRAFPSAAIDDAFGGMTKREWFAGMALAGMLAHPQVDSAPLGDLIAGVPWTTILAKDAYRIADAMIEAGKRDG